MKRRILLLLAVLLLLACAAWCWLGSPASPPANLRTDGPLLLSFQNVVRDTNQLTVTQLKGRADMFSSSPQLTDPGLAHDRYFLLTNSGSRTLRIYAYNRSMPRYHIELRTNNDWTQLPTVWSSSGGVIMLKPGQSLVFPAITPDASAYRLGVTYEIVHIPITALDNLIDWSLRIVYPNKRRESVWFLVLSDEIQLTKPTAPKSPH